MRHLCVYCGSGPGRNPVYMATAKALGAAMANLGIGLVYGGGSLGLMGEVARSVIAGGGHVVGIIPEFLVNNNTTGSQTFGTIAALADGRFVIAWSDSSVNDGDTRAQIFNPDVIHTRDNPLVKSDALVVLRGNLAPDGAVLKPPAAEPHLLKHKGPAVVFDSYEEMKKQG